MAFLFAALCQHARGREAGSNTRNLEARAAAPMDALTRPRGKP